MSQICHLSLIGGFIWYGCVWLIVMTVKPGKTAGNHAPTHSKTMGVSVAKLADNTTMSNKTIEVGADVSIVGENAHYNLGASWEVLTIKKSGDVTLTDEKGIDTLTVSKSEIEVKA